MNKQFEETPQHFGALALTAAPCGTNDNKMLINFYISEIINSSDEFSCLVEKKKEIITTIEKKMKGKARQNQRLTRSQINSFKQFCEYSSNTFNKVNSTVYSVELMERLANTQREILKDEMDCSAIISELTELYLKFKEAVEVLKAYVFNSYKYAVEL